MVDAESAGVRRRAPRYEDEDTSATTDRELKGWYSYGVAAEVFAVCGVGSFLPVTLEQLAKEHGVLRSDGVTSCLAPKNPAPESGAGGDPANTAANALMRFVRRAAEGQDAGQCVVHPFGKPVSTASFAMYTFSLAVLVQALVLISFSSVADYGTYRKKFLLAFGYVGAASSMLFIIVSPRLYVLGSVLVIIGVVCLGSSFVLLNSFLPLLAWNDPSVAEATSMPLHDMDDGEFGNDDYAFASSSAKSPEQPASPALTLSTKISSKGVGLGYIAAVFVQVLSIGLLFGLSKVHFSSPSIPLRTVLFLVGIWWGVFTIPCALWLRDRPGPPLQSSMSRQGRVRQVFTYITFAWGSVWKTVKVAVQLRQTVLFLIAWFLLSDSIATISGTAILFARTELHMGTVPIALLSITATSSGIAGAFIWPIISRKYQLPTHKTIIACILLMEIIPLYGLLGFLPFIQRWGVGGLQQMWEIYPLGVVLGLVMGGLSSYCRSFYGLLIPPGSEASFYALYAITDKGSSAVGPAVVGWIVDAVGTIRPAFGFVAVLLALPIPLILMIDAEKGRADAVSIAETLGMNGKVGSGHAYSAARTAEESDDEDGTGLLARAHRD
ncbi:hypothetical protein AAFC00_001985 [Neodothiora populina]|uniref:Autophagy-related protein n=1 Tax=Neodothiora populina TaxID=2781224 RepID=A0ABR3PGB5_9PEZI